jgi:hypothetical protein
VVIAKTEGEIDLDRYREVVDRPKHR